MTYSGAFWLDHFTKPWLPARFGYRLLPSVSDCVQITVMSLVGLYSSTYSVLRWSQAVCVGAVAITVKFDVVPVHAISSHSLIITDLRS